MADTLQDIGARMANVMFNLAQRPGEPITGDIVATMDRLRKQWYAALASRLAEVDGSPVDQACARVRRAEAELKAARKALMDVMTTAAHTDE